MSKKVVNAIYGICIAVMLVLPFVALAEETPDSIAGKADTFVKKYPPFDVKRARREAEEAYPMARPGDEVQISTQKGKIIGKFHGLQGDGIKVGSKIVPISSLSESEKIYFDQALCEDTRRAYVDNKFTEYVDRKNRNIGKYKNTLIGTGAGEATMPPEEDKTNPGESTEDNAASADANLPGKDPDNASPGRESSLDLVFKTPPPPDENKAKPDESQKDAAVSADVKTPASNPDNTAPAGKPSGAAKPDAKKKKEQPPSLSMGELLMPFSPVNIILLFAWFLSGLYALKTGEKKLQNNEKLLSFYNLFAIFLGPLAFLFCYLSSDGIDFMKNIFSPKLKKKKYKEFPITIIDSKGNTATSDIGESLSFVKHMLLNALQKGASDIFIDPKIGSYSIRIRVDGVIKVVTVLEDEQALPVISTIKVAAGMDIAEKRRPQDGSFSANTETYQASFRVASVGVSGGEKITLRVIGSDVGQYKLDSIGLSNEQYKLVSSTIKLPSGMVLMCGPTGSGKTSTLYSMLGAIDYNIKNVISIEDPVEHVMPNVSQMEVNVKAGITFASLLRNSLRQNPDIICLGEIRDEETAQIAVNASQTGHLIIATIHSNDNIGTIDRLTNLGVTLRSIAATLQVVISQRLIRKLCKHCKVKAKLTPAQEAFLEEYGISPDNVYASRGCSSCDGTGYSGRRALFEILVMDAGLCAVLEAPDASNTTIRAYVEKNNNMANIAGQALMLVGEAVTSYEEFERVTLNI